MVQILFLLLSCAFSNHLFAEIERELLIQGDRIKTPFALKPLYLVTDNDLDDVGELRVISASVFRVEKTFLKTMSFQFSKGGKPAEVPGLFVVVNEESFERGKNEKGEAAEGLPARIVLTLVPYLFTRKPSALGEAQTLVGQVNFLLSGAKPLTLEIRNKKLAQIKEWGQEGNYLFKEKPQPEVAPQDTQLPYLPAMNLARIMLTPKADKDTENFQKLKNSFFEEE